MVLGIACLARWSGPARGADDSLLARVTGPALDIGCGPGRLVAALAARGVPALGIDIAPAAVGLTRRAGGRALQLSVFDEVPDAGRWGCAVLADGNIGIGGDPVRLLRRSAELLAAGGQVLVELAAPRSGSRAVQVRLEDADGNAGAWFPWAHVAADALAPLALQAGLRVVEAWCEPAVGDPLRWFAALALV
ncbi:MAG: class I SAM-dependent methyltransferase [Actinobacteria bacterium]|nr:class I SAM-dependent methyltransferase [Actinomycetota bacterium]